MQRKVTGFTLIELMITIAIASIFALIAIPSMSQMAKSNAVSSYTNSIFNSILLAKSEASKRSDTITLETTDWSLGWQMKQGATILRNFDALPAIYTLSTSQNISSIGFRADGTSTYNGTFNFNLRINANCQSGLAKNISISPIGVVKITEADCDA